MHSRNGSRGLETGAEREQSGHSSLQDCDQFCVHPYKFETKYCNTGIVSKTVFVIDFLKGLVHPKFKTILSVLLI